MLLAVALLAPYLELLLMHWFSASGHAMASLLALAAAIMVAWLQRPAALAGPPQRNGLGLALLAVFVLAYALALSVLTRRTLVGGSATAIVACLCYLRYGGQGLQRLRYPLLLALLAIPFPGRLLDFLTYHLVGLASLVGTTVLSWLVAGVSQEGSVIVIAGHGAVEVVEDCSGLDGVLLFLPIAVTVVYFQPRLSGIAKAAILALAMPLALLGNLLRILLSGLLQVHYAELNRSEAFHQVVGIISLGLALLALIWLPRLLRRWPTTNRVTPRTGEATP
jgi:exosortase